MNSTMPKFNAEASNADDMLSENFEQIEAAVQETERGRWFLREFSRRQRSVETAEILTALERLTRRMVAYESHLNQSLRGSAANEGLSDALPRDNFPPVAEIRGFAEEGAPMLRPRGDLSERLEALKEIDALDAEAKLKLFA